MPTTEVPQQCPNCGFESTIARDLGTTEVVAPIKKKKSKSAKSKKVLGDLCPGCGEWMYVGVVAAE